MEKNVQNLDVQADEITTPEEVIEEAVDVKEEATEAMLDRAATEAAIEKAAAADATEGSEEPEAKDVMALFEAMKTETDKILAELTELKAKIAERKAGINGFFTPAGNGKEETRKELTVDDLFKIVKK